MAGDPVVTVIPRLPDDPHRVAEDDPTEFLIGLLDWVGDRVVPNQSVPCDHIAPDLLGSWSLYQLLTFHAPPFGAVHSLEFMAVKLSLVELETAAKAAASAISDIEDPSFKQDAFESKIFGVPVADWGELASWVEKNLQTVLLPDREAWDQFHEDLDSALSEAHPTIWRAERVCSIGEPAQRLAEITGLSTLYRHYQKGWNAPQHNNPIFYTIYRTNRIAGTENKLMAVIDFSDCHILADLETQSEVARIPLQREARAKWSAESQPKFKLETEIMGVDTRRLRLGPSFRYKPV